MVAFADSHVHLADAAFASDVDDVIARALAVGARALVCIGESPAAAVRAQAIAARHVGLVYHTCGVHPQDAASWDAHRDAEAIRQAVVVGAVAIGECGLDYHYDNAPRAVQRDVLTSQLLLASETQRPMVLHTRDAEDDTRAFLRDAAAAGVKGVLHCFTGSHDLADAGLEAAWYVSLGGIVTFRSWTNVGILTHIPDHRLLVESDAPYLAPVPYRGKRNEPAFVRQTLARIADARGTTPERLGDITLSNTARLFALPSLADAPN